MKDNQQQHACNIIILSEIATNRDLPVAVKFFAGWLRSFGANIYMSNRSIITRYTDETGVLLSERQLRRYIWQLEITGLVDVNIRDNCKRVITFCTPDKNVLPPDKNVLPPDKNVLPPDKNVHHSKKISNTISNTISSRYDDEDAQPLIDDVKYLYDCMSQETIVYYLERFFKTLDKKGTKPRPRDFVAFALYCRKDDAGEIQHRNNNIPQHEYSNSELNALFTPLDDVASADNY